jgi:cAMP-dependent protein kinase regulator
MGEPPPRDSGAPAAPPNGVVETPLFQGFSQDELVAVMRGLRLLAFEPGDIIITEGDPGDSLFILTTGRVKAFLHNVDGPGQRLARTMGDGAFFGEISILSGKPRTATVAAVTPCELLELDRPTLDEITKTYPHVLDVLQEFYIQRATGQGS